MERLLHPYIVIRPSSPPRTHILPLLVFILPERDGKRIPLLKDHLHWWVIYAESSEQFRPRSHKTADSDGVCFARSLAAAWMDGRPYSEHVKKRVWYPEEICRAREDGVGGGTHKNTSRVTVPAFYFPPTLSQLRQRVSGQESRMEGVNKCWIILCLGWIREANLGALYGGGERAMRQGDSWGSWQWRDGNWMACCRGPKCRAPVRRNPWFGVHWSPAQL